MNNINTVKPKLTQVQNILIDTYSPTLDSLLSHSSFLNTQIDQLKDKLSLLSKEKQILQSKSYYLKSLKSLQKSNPQNKQSQLINTNIKRYKDLSHLNPKKESSINKKLYNLSIMNIIADTITIKFKNDLCYSVSFKHLSSSSLSSKSNKKIKHKSQSQKLIFSRNNNYSLSNKPSLNNNNNDKIINNSSNILNSILIHDDSIYSRLVKTSSTRLKIGSTSNKKISKEKNNPEKTIEYRINRTIDKINITNNRLDYVDSYDYEVRQMCNTDAKEGNIKKKSSSVTLKKKMNVNNNNNNYNHNKKGTSIEKKNKAVKDKLLVYKKEMNNNLKHLQVINCINKIFKRNINTYQAEFLLKFIDWNNKIIKNKHNSWVKYYNKMEINLKKFNKENKENLISIDSSNKIDNKNSLSLTIKRNKNKRNLNNMYSLYTDYVKTDSIRSKCYNKSSFDKSVTNYSRTPNYGNYHNNNSINYTLSSNRKNVTKDNSFVNSNKNYCIRNIKKIKKFISSNSVENPNTKVKFAKTEVDYNNNNINMYSNMAKVSRKIKGDDEKSNLSERKKLNVNDYINSKGNYSKIHNNNQENNLSNRSKNNNVSSYNKNKIKSTNKSNINLVKKIEHQEKNDIKTDKEKENNIKPLFNKNKTLIKKSFSVVKKEDKKSDKNILKSSNFPQAKQRKNKSYDEPKVKQNISINKKVKVIPIKKKESINKIDINKENITNPSEPINNNNNNSTNEKGIVPNTTNSYTNKLTERDTILSKKENVPLSNITEIPCYEQNISKSQVIIKDKDIQSEKNEDKMVSNNCDDSNKEKTISSHETNDIQKEIKEDIKIEPKIIQIERNEDKIVPNNYDDSNKEKIISLHGTNDKPKEIKKEIKEDIIVEPNVIDKPNIILGNEQVKNNIFKSKSLSNFIISKNKDLNEETIDKYISPFESESNNILIKQDNYKLNVIIDDELNDLLNVNFDEDCEDIKLIENKTIMLNNLVGVNNEMNDIKEKLILFNKNNNIC